MAIGHSKARLKRLNVEDSARGEKGCVTDAIGRHLTDHTDGLQEYSVFE
jgi:hypothetical protein